MICSGSYLKKPKTKNSAVILRLTHDLSGLETLNFSTLCLEIRDLPTVRLSFCLDQFISTFSNINHSAKFENLKISTKKVSLRTILRPTVCILKVWQFTAIKLNYTLVFAMFLLTSSNLDADLKAPAGRPVRKNCCSSDQWPTMHIDERARGLHKEPSFVTNPNE